MSPALLRIGRLGLLTALATAGCGIALAQSQSEAQKKLEGIRKELKDVAAERRDLEGQRGEASRQLRAADEQVGSSSRKLAQTQTALQKEEAALAELQAKRDTMQQHLSGERKELSQLVRAAYMTGSNAPLKVLLSQDKVADANRAMVYHRYVQGDVAHRIEALTGQLEELRALEAEIETRRAALQTTHKQQQSQVAQLKRDRGDQAKLVAQLDQKYEDRSDRAQALGRDAKALETLLANLRAAAARAEAERRAAAERARREQAAREAAARAQAQKDRDEALAEGRPAPPPRKAPPPPPQPKVASAPALKVGGLGWPASGNLLARFGGQLPDGRTSQGVLIGAPVGSSVTAVADGTVVFSEWMTGYGLILIIDHGNGYMSLYAHNESLLRDAGDTVKKGDAVAKVGSSGGWGTPALYFELRKGGSPVDPSSWLQRR
ncbi:Septal ring factor EnvC, activator of murein hydrolases AmiA and AmiB [Pseudoxanthomonas sp. GM95]|uniref:murein hydrolase activator EnvC family protein n=1 Tax=Pseudoxanthomonas sp. GM95 TaxID=1881043 RepID=UPI0008D12094|nr:peptidoglycan DD-metalloendopeptidase family protein [Pseudoxanthomonas sp. GM95]SEM13674.1 Septal ring factor EnvC, activator of murein hydrolases AmiA and AmiB [Pseudoxanthomonas sp. GM95]